MRYLNILLFLCLLLNVSYRSLANLGDEAEDAAASTTSSVLSAGTAYEEEPKEDGDGIVKYEKLYILKSLDKNETSRQNYGLDEASDLHWDSQKTTPDEIKSIPFLSDPLLPRH